MKEKASDGVTYPGDGQRHVEVLATLQSESPWCWSFQHHLVSVHVTHFCGEEDNLEL